jgi:DNA-binding response OmpR family regulator
VLRKNERETQNGAILSLGEVKIHISEGKVYKREDELILTAQEYLLLLMFAKNKG